MDAAERKDFAKDIGSREMNWVNDQDSASVIAKRGTGKAESNHIDIPPIQSCIVGTRVIKISGGFVKRYHLWELVKWTTSINMQKLSVLIRNLLLSFQVLLEKTLRTFPFIRCHSLKSLTRFALQNRCFTQKEIVS